MQGEGRALLTPIARLSGGVARGWKQGELGVDFAALGGRTWTSSHTADRGLSAGARGFNLARAVGQEWF